MPIKLNVFVFIISIVTSFGLNHDVKTISDCKLVHLENCNGHRHKCTVEISVINKCVTNYVDERIKNKCENFVDSDLIKNAFLFRPVTNKLENVTYWNVYCALCNRQTITEENFVFWTLQAHHIQIEGIFANESKPVTITESSSFISDVDSAAIEKMKLHNETKLLISEFRGSVRKVVPLRYLPFGLRNTSPYEFCSSLTANNGNDQLQVNSTVAAPEDFSCAEKKFCSSKKIPQPESCVYLARNNVPCSINQFLVRYIDFVYYKGKIIRKDGRIFDQDSFFLLNEDLVFLCGTKETEKPIVRIMRKLTRYMKFTSTILLVIFLILKTNKKNFKSLPKLILYSYCVASLGVYLYQIFIHSLLMEMYGVVIKTYALIYIFLCHAFWASIISYEYWYVISSALKVQKANVELKKYWIYGFIGWVLPALLLCGVYPSLTEEDKISNCFVIPGHKNRNISESFSELAHLLHASLVILSVLIFFILIPIVAVQGYFFTRLVRDKRNMAQQNTQGNSNATRSISELDYWLIFSKIAYLMGIHWMLICINLLLSFLDYSFIFSNLGSVLFSCHGTFIFFAFGFKNVRTLYKNTYDSFNILNSHGIQSTHN